MAKTNPSGYRPMTWTTDEYIPPSTAKEQGPEERTKEPTPLQLAQIILHAIRPFPDAYRAMLAALDAFWLAPAPNSA